MIEIVCSAILIAISVLSLIAWSWWHFRSNYRDDMKSLDTKIDTMQNHFSDKIDCMQKGILDDISLLKERIAVVERDIKWIKKTMEDERDHSA